MELTLFTESQKEKIEHQIDELQQELNYDTRDYPISYLVDLYNDEDEAVFAPEYQRKASLWSVYDKSRFIESLLLDYPIPLIFLADAGNGKLEIVDGLQRISTLASFLNNDFDLAKLKKLTESNGCSFIDLPDREKRRLKTKSLRIIVLKQSTDETKQELFDRLNTSSLRASTSEVRSGREINNPLMKLIVELIKDETFKRTTNLSKTVTNRKGDIELITRFFAYSNNLENFSGKVMNFVDEFVDKSRDQWSEEKELTFRTEFESTMNFVDEHFERGFQKENKNQTPRVRFEAIAVGVNLALREKPSLKVDKEKIKMLLESEDFKKWTTSDAANNRKKVLDRINGVKDFLIDESK